MANQRQDFHNAPHHRANNSLLIQFLLHELLQAFAITADYQKLIHSITLTPHLKYTKKGKEQLQNAYELITQLAGKTSQSMRIFSWNLNEGIIAKLRQYSTFFGNNLDSQDSDAIQLDRHAERAWVNCLECLDLTREQLSLPLKEPANLKFLINYSDKLCVRIQKLAQVISNILPQFRDDETVLYYLINYQDALALLWGPKFLPKLFKQLFPSGKEEAEHFLKVRYNKRHFSHHTLDLANKFSRLFSNV
ncbi:putative uncharacterized protein [Waddlia chondrophila 2032/99]|uniref:Uncharacterized protein n=2 Tax=Waddlia chondrophila TaxID=71667 RepID=D6YRL2_WADCW|nr:hypothetical protein [Waddlia chondrophila]ADI38707.1 hypothetical protein wcw_1356 [Waddlia chondrophila WSU 86-1044]CCB92278.1 putative uncharacterized protein [Waddlia chondrophila 2032/99]